MDKKRIVTFGVLLLMSLLVLAASFRSAGRPAATTSRRAQPEPDKEDAAPAATTSRRAQPEPDKEDAAPAATTSRRAQPEPDKEDAAPAATTSRRAQPEPDKEDAAQAATRRFWAEAAAALARADELRPAAAPPPLLRNPMDRPPPPAVLESEFFPIIRDPEKDLVLSGILLGDKGAYAIINGEVIQPGDDLGGVVVDSVETGRVTLLAGPERREVVLYLE